jgi:hypothetical protein
MLKVTITNITDGTQTIRLVAGWSAELAERRRFIDSVRPSTITAVGFNMTAVGTQYRYAVEDSPEPTVVSDWRIVRQDWNSDRDALILRGYRTTEDSEPVDRIVGPAGPWGYRDMSPADASAPDVEWPIVWTDRIIENGQDIIDVDGEAWNLDLRKADRIEIVHGAAFHYGREEAR